MSELTGRRMLVFGCREQGLVEVKRYTELGYRVTPADEDAGAEHDASQLNGGWMSDWSYHKKDGRSAEWIWTVHNREPYDGAIICPPYTEDRALYWACVEAGIPHVAVHHSGHVNVTYSHETGRQGAATWFSLGDLETLRFIVGAERSKRRCGASEEEHIEWCAKLDMLVGRVEQLVPRGTVAKVTRASWDRLRGWWAS